MNLHTQLLARAAAGRPVRIGLIGAGKFGSMFLAQARRTPGLHVLGIADLAPGRVRASLARLGWPAAQVDAPSLDAAARDGRTWVGEDAAALIAHPALEVVIEATGAPKAGIRHALLACAARKHLVMVNVEADALAGPVLARRAAEAGIVYSMAYGDQPALILEQIDWARACGFDVVCAGKGTKHLPAFHASTPDTVWQHYGFSPQQVATGDFNAQMFNSFLDGTKSALEMAAVANGSGLQPPPDGLTFPPCGADDLPTVLRPASAGGVLPQAGTVEVVSSLHPDGTPVARDLRWGVFVVIEAPSEYVRDCFAQYGLRTDPSGCYTALYRPCHLIGLELGISVASVALRGEPTGTTRAFHGDVVAVAKRPLRAGELLDGEGGYTVYGRLLPAARSLALGALPIGLAHRVKLRTDVAAGDVVRWSEVACDESDEAVRLRRELERDAPV
ncbi:MAG: flagellar biosynthesis protein FlgA [Verrucomicrobia bacterium]|nr:flagellar biosynthesis protein FlgA [Verrucomicrobiota bacterium]